MKGRGRFARGDAPTHVPVIQSGMEQEMQVRFTRHARQRMLQRRIAEREVIYVLEAPDELNDGDMGETIAVKRLLDDELRVVYQEDDDSCCDHGVSVASCRSKGVTNAN